MALIDVPFDLVSRLPGGGRAREAVAAAAFRSLRGDGDEADIVEVFRRNPGDPGLFGPDSVSWRLHDDVAPLFVGGVAALMLQTLHPVVMAGVAEHSNYRDDPFGRLERTGTFVAATTYGSMPVVEEAVAAVRAVHRRVVGVAPDGRPYSAADPDAITWVHATEHAMFLAAHQHFARRPLDPVESDRYLAEAAEVAMRLGAEWVPRSAAELEAYFGRIRPELYRGPQARETLRFLETGAFRAPGEVAAYRVVAAAAKALLPSWARRMCGFQLPPLVGTVARRLAVDPPARLFVSASRWLIGDPLVSATARQRVAESPAAAA